MSIKKFCTTHVVMARKGDHVREAARKMAEKNVGAVVVTDNHSAPLGIVTDRDIVVKVVNLGKDPDTTLIGDIMSPNVATLREDGDLVDASRVMMEHGVRRLPVVDGSGKVIGILSLDDILMVLERELNNLSKTISQNMKPENPR